MASVAETLADDLPAKTTRKVESFGDVKPPINPDSWGYHLMVDASDCATAIDSKTVIRDFFKELVSKIKMKTLSPLTIERAPKEEGRGLSAMQMITTSTITAHFDDAGNRAFIDVFSCKTFDDKVAIAVIKDHFKPKKLASKFIYRDA